MFMQTTSTHAEGPQHETLGQLCKCSGAACGELQHLWSTSSACIGLSASDVEPQILWA